MDVAAFYQDFDTHPGDRIRLFAALAQFIQPQRVLYPGSYVDISPSVFFEHVTYADMDKRAARFFAQDDDVHVLVERMRQASGTDADFDLGFVHADYRQPLEAGDATFDLLVSLYGGFVSEHCSRYLRPGGHLLVNNSHGDASMAELDPDYELQAVVTTSSTGYRVTQNALDGYLVPKGAAPTKESLHSSGRGVAFTKQAFAYVFLRTP